MRKAFALFPLASVLFAAPALAQTGDAPLSPDGVANVNLVGKVGLNGSTATKGVTDPVGGTVERIGGAADRAVDAANLTLATREQVRAGAEIYDTSGNSVGTVQSVEGDTAVVVRDGKLYNVPIAEIYHGAVGASHGLVTKLSRAEIQARTTAAVE